jgi:endonuclease IV
MRILVTDWAELDQVLPMAQKYQVGLEVLEFAMPENLDRATTLADEIRNKVSGISLLGMHGPFSELVPASRDPLVRGVARTRFQQGYDLAQTIGAQHLILHSGYFPKTYPREQWIKFSVVFWVDCLRINPPNMIHVENVYEDDFTALQELVDG